ncbi:hypothetical protein BACI71_70427 [Bacillus mycoides]|uniref:Uncharacterized protein n=1 Tax=Bacillus mycoides TaxID=1405 RepID=A0A654BFU7_BACMY|nr:hypothetical protein BACI71_70427 [Bacillus mycoides]
MRWGSYCPLMRGKLLGVIYIEYFSIRFNINKGCVKIWNCYGLFQLMEMVDI